MDERLQDRRRSLTTHDAGGLTENDIKMAKADRRIR